MTFSQLHERLRLEMWRRIQRGVVTGKLLAAQTGLRPSHISNFLHRKRKLSLAALDRLLAAQQITIQELAGFPPEGDDQPDGNTADTLRIPLIVQTAAVALPLIPARSIQSYIALPSAELDRFAPHYSTGRRSWERFIAVRVTGDQATAMEPLLQELSIVIVDRHHNSLVPFAPPHPNLYALRVGNRLLLRYVTFDSDRLLLRPHRLDFPLEAMEIPPNDLPSDLLIGRVCLCISEV
jgi:transcriptional regulator with XRE-family HTH domain